MGSQILAHKKHLLSRPSDKLYCLNSFQVASIKKGERGWLLMAQTLRLRGHIAGIPSKGLTPITQSSTDKHNLPSFQTRYMH